MSAPAIAVGQDPHAAVAPEQDPAQALPLMDQPQLSPPLPVSALGTSIVRLFECWPHMERTRLLHSPAAAIAPGSAPVDHVQQPAQQVIAHVVPAPHRDVQGQNLLRYFMVTVELKNTSQESKLL